MKQIFCLALISTAGIIVSCKSKPPERPLFGNSKTADAGATVESDPYVDDPIEEEPTDDKGNGGENGDSGSKGSGESGKDDKGSGGSKPVDNKGGESKPVDTKPVDTKPVDTKPAEPKPAEPKPMVPTPKEPTMRELITEAQFNEILKERIPFYTYQGFIAAAEATPKFAKTGTVEMRKTEIAAILANGMHESDHFKAVREYNMAVWGHYCDPKQVPCAAGQTYQGRGPIQLSWNYNYKDAGTDLGIDLLNNPDLVATDPKIAFQTMFWFWTKRGAVTCHDAIVNGKGGFSQTIKTINGGLECNPNRTAVQKEQALMRGTYFKKVMKIMGLPEPTGNLDCL